jgi:hypothetical protein
MKIYDENSKRLLTAVTLFLTPEEAANLSEGAADLVKNPRKHHHHISNKDLDNEITVAVYTPENIAKFDQESQEILKETS